MLNIIKAGVANARPAATPECHDGDTATLPETEGPFFKPSSPERTNLFEPGKALPVDFTQCDHEYVAVLSGDLASCRGDDCSNVAVPSRIFLEWAILA
jgi:hypothetical protein